MAGRGRVLQNIGILLHHCKNLKIFIQRVEDRYNWLLIKHSAQ